MIERVEEKHARFWLWLGGFAEIFDGLVMVLSFGYLMSDTWMIVNRIYGDKVFANLNVQKQEDKP